MIRKTIMSLIFLAGSMEAFAQKESENKHVVIVTLDGFRWQEIFRGADPRVLGNPKYSKNKDLIKQFSGPTPEARRMKLLPFFWKTLSEQGQLYGNRDLNNEISCSNPYWFSYPGYHELFVGAVNRKVCSNLKIENPDNTVLEFLNRQTEYKNSVSAFATWDVLPFILGARCSGVRVNAGTEQVNGPRPLTDNEMRLNSKLAKTGNRTDSITFHLAFENLQQDRTRILYISLDETDHFAHADKYDEYLSAAHRADEWLASLWRWIQNDPEYKDNTTLIISTDHGRGQNSKKSWRHHGRLTIGSNQIWMAAIGPNVSPTGEQTTRQRLYQKQIASTIAWCAGYQYKNSFPVAAPINTLAAQPAVIARNESSFKNERTELTSYRSESGQSEK